MYKPQFTITNPMLKFIGVIEACKHVIDTAPLLPHYEKKFQDDALIRSVHHGTHLEGNELNLNQAEKVMLGQDVVARQRDVQEVINYRKVMEFIGNVSQAEEEKHPGQKRVITEEFIKALHRAVVSSLLSPERSGEYRKTQVVIRNSITGEVTFTPPAALAIPYQMSDFIEFINTSDEAELHPIIKSGIVHYELVRIHPFIDGNGRVGRALSTLMLFIGGYDIRRFFSLEEYFDKDAARYYEALQSVGKSNGDVTHWLEYFMEGLAIELTKIRDKVEHISRDIKLKEKLGGKQLMLTDRQLTIIEYIQKTGYMNNSMFKHIFPFVSEDTVLNELKPLIQNNLVKKQGKTKAARYVMA
ncbi:Dot/Icm type IV secretion system effector CoxFIC1 [soil metagenome]